MWRGKGRGRSSNPIYSNPHRQPSKMEREAASQGQSSLPSTILPLLASASPYLSAGLPYLVLRLCYLASVRLFHTKKNAGRRAIRLHHHSSPASFPPFQSIRLCSPSFVLFEDRTRRKKKNEGSIDPAGSIFPLSSVSPPSNPSPTEWKTAEWRWSPSRSFFFSHARSPQKGRRRS